MLTFIQSSSFSSKWSQRMLLSLLSLQGSSCWVQCCSLEQPLSPKDGEETTYPEGLANRLKRHPLRVCVCVCPNLHVLKNSTLVHLWVHLRVHLQLHFRCSLMGAWPVMPLHVVLSFCLVRHVDPFRVCLRVMCVSGRFCQVSFLMCSNIIISCQLILVRSFP